MFLREALGSYFSTDYDEANLKNEIAFFGEEQTVLTLKEESITMYKLTIESKDSKIVRGMIGYLDEVIEETSAPLCIHFFS